MSVFRSAADEDRQGSNYDPERTSVNVSAPGRNSKKHHRHT